MGYIRTYTGIKMEPNVPRPEDFCIDDIAHALSLMTRANGHFKTFYSVAQHCIGCAKEAKARGYSKRVQLGCLLHDASEAYIFDITRPVKELLPLYKDVENTLQDMIFVKWLKTPLSEEENREVFDIDDTMLYWEFIHFMNEEVLDRRELISTQSYDFQPFLEVEAEYLNIFHELYNDN